MQTIKTKNCLVSPGKQARFEANTGDTIYFRDESAQIAEGVIQSVSSDRLSVSLFLSNGGGIRDISGESIIAVVVGES